MENLQKVEILSNDLQKNDTCMKFTSLHRQLVKFRELKQAHKLDLISELSQNVPRIRNGEIAETGLCAFMSSINNSPFALSTLSSWLDLKEREIEFLTNYLNGLKPVKFCSSPAEIVDDAENDIVVCFNILIADDDKLLDNMTQYQRNKKVLKKPSKQSIMPWLENPVIVKSMRERLKQLKAFVEKYGCTQKIKCIVTNFKPTGSGATTSQVANIIMYIDGVKLVSEPGTPGQPKVTAATANSISMEWTDPEYGMTEHSTYVVYYCPAECQSKKWTSIKTGSCDNHFTIINLPSKTAYYLKVKPVDSEFSFESPISGLALTKPSAAPGKPIARDIRSRTVQLEWTKPECNAEKVESYSVHCISKATNESILPPVPCTKEKCTILMKGLSPKNVYIFTVMANYGKEDESFKSEPSDSIETNQSFHPGQPKIVEVGSSYVGIEWSEPEHTVSMKLLYTVHLSDSAEDVWKAIPELKNHTQCEANIRNLKPKSKYKFKVVAKCAEHEEEWESEPSDSIETKPPCYLSKPSAISSDCDKMMLKWQKPDCSHDHMQFYTVSYCVDDPSEVWKEVNHSTQDLEMEICELKPKTSYKFKVKVKCGDNVHESDPSESVRTKPSRCPSQPIASQVRNDRILLKWLKPGYEGANVQSYSVFYCFHSSDYSDSQGHWQEAKEKISYESLLMVKRNVCSKSVYKFKIVASYSDRKDKNWESEPSKPVETLPSYCPGQPRVSNIDCNTVHLVWSKPTHTDKHVKSYTVLLSLSETSNTWLEAQAKTITEFEKEVFHLEPNMQYQFKVVANYSGEVEVSESWPGIASEPIRTKLSRCPGKPKPTTVEKNKILLKWAKPEYSDEPVNDYTVLFHSQPSKVTKSAQVRESINWQEVKEFERIDETEFVILNLMPKTVYVFQIVAKYHDSDKPWQSENSDPIETELSHLPQKPFATRVNSTEVVLKWNKVEYTTEQVEKYFINYVARSTQQCFQVEVPGYATEAVIGKLIPNEEYQFQVQAVYKELTFSPFTELSESILTHSSRSPGKPVISEMENHTLCLKWKEPEYDSISVLEYTIMYKKASAKNFQVHSSVKSRSLMLEIMDVQPKTKYMFKVVAMYDRGSYASEIIEITTKPLRTPGKPHATMTDCDKVELEWAAPDCDVKNIFRYSIKYQPCNEPHSNFKEVQLKTKETKGIATGLSPKTLYTFKICVEYKMNRYKCESKLSDQILTLPSRAPSGLAQKHVTNCSVCLTWNEPECKETPVKHYCITYSMHTSKQPSGGIFTEKNPPETELVVQNLTPSTRYIFKISAIYEHGEYPSSDIVRLRTEDVCCPGEPKLVEQTQSSITLKWDAPEYGAYDVQHYTVKKRNITDSLTKKETVIENTSNTSATIENLTPDSRYYFEIIPCTVSLACKSSENKQPFCTNSVPLAIRIRAKSSRISKQGAEPTIYELTMKEEISNAPNRISKFSVGEKEQRAPAQERVLMLVGATGAGKSTLINGMVNYILGVKWEDRFRFKLVNDGENRSQIHSQTKWITSYTIYHMKGSKINYTLTLIDTPGFGDTEGVQRDKQLVLQIKELFSMKNGIDALHGIGFVAQSPSARLTPTQRYIFDSILSIFGKDIANNIMLMITFADGSSPPVLEAVKAAGVPFQGFFKFNNSALFANPASADEQTNFDNMFWKMGLASFQKFFQNLAKMVCRSLTLTKEVLEERDQLECVVQALQPHIKIGLGKIGELEQEEQVLDQHRAQIEANEDFTYTVEALKMRKTMLSPGTYVTNCMKCNSTCHENCRIPNSEEKFNCLSMDFQGNESKAKCTVCPKHCHWKEHCNNNFKFDTYTEKEEREYSDLKQRYEQAKSGETEASSIIVQLREELKKEEETVFIMMAKAHESLTRLDEIALRPNPLTQVEYIDLIIDSEKREVRSGWEKRVKTLEEIKKKAAILNKLRHTSTDRAEDTLWWKNWLDDDETIFQV